MVDGGFVLLTTWLVCAVVLIGLGALGLQILGATFRLADAFWTGLGMGILLLLLVHFFLPIGIAAPAALGGLALGTLIQSRRAVLLELRRLLPDGLVVLLLGAIVAVSTAWRCTGPWAFYDTGLYGAMAVHWIKAFPLVPGLANLHGRLGFNTTAFLCFAALDQGIWSGLSQHVFNGLILSGFSFTPLMAIWRIIVRGESSPANWFFAMLLAPVIYWSSFAELLGTETDLVPAAMGLSAAGMLFSHLSSKTPATIAGSAGSANIDSRLAVVIFLSAVTVTLKLSMAVFAGMIGVIAIIALHAARGGLGRPIILSFALIIPWIIRGIVLSGDPFYPSTIAAVHCDWRIPATIAHNDALWIQSWARLPGPPSETRGWQWIPRWMSRQMQGPCELIAVPFSCAALGLALMGSLKVIGIRRVSGSGRMLLASACGITFWFITAPDPRFAQAAIWTCAAVSLAGILPRIPHSRWAAPAIIALAIFCISPRTVRHLQYDLHTGYSEFAPMPAPPMRQYITTSGLVLWVPVTPDQCWNAPLPCTPYPRMDLRLRNPANMGDGFTLR